MWSFSAFAGFVCALLAISLLMHGAVDSGELLLAGSLGLFAWAGWLFRREH